MEDVYKEVDSILTKQKVEMHKMKPCQRKYAFEKTDIPKEAEYLKALYSYESKKNAPLGPLDLISEQNPHCRSIFMARHSLMSLAPTPLSSSSS